MAILYGTTGDGTTLPVLVDQFGNLLAKGIDGQPGTPGQDGAPGPPGPPGADGGSFLLPLDPFEGALLGWENGGLAWIGNAPIPVPPGRFGPIAQWDPQGLIEVEGDVPSKLTTGDYVYQCNEDGSIFVDGWNNSEKWSDNVSATGGLLPSTPPSNAFDGDLDTYVDALSTGQVLTVAFPGGLSYLSSVEVYVRQRNVFASVNNGTQVEVNGDDTSFEWAPVVTGYGTMESLQIIATTNYNGLAAIRVDGKELIDFGTYPVAPNLNFRVNTINQNVLVGVRNIWKDFTVGKYLRIPQVSAARRASNSN